MGEGGGETQFKRAVRKHEWEGLKGRGYIFSIGGGVGASPQAVIIVNVTPARDGVEEGTANVREEKGECVPLPHSTVSTGQSHGYIMGIIL